MTRKDSIMEVFKATLWAITGLLTLFVLGFVLNGYGLVTLKIFGPAFQNARTETFQNTDAYRVGVSQQLSKMVLDYRLADDTQKPIIADALRRYVATVPANLVTGDAYAVINAR